MVNKESNSYTLIFSAVLVVLVGVLLTVVFEITNKPYEKSVEMEKRQNILSAAMGKTLTREEADQMFVQYIKESKVYNSAGEEVQGQDAFTLDLSKELKKPEAEQLYPMFIFQDGSTVRYILGMRGTGLWGPIWGYIAIESDLNSVFYANFDHKGETPGLGAEIKQAIFQDQFALTKGKKIYENNEFRGVLVEKKGKTSETSEEYKHVVNGISGGTITSDGVSNMLQKYLKAFDAYIKKAGIAPATQQANLQTNASNQQP
ncbi:MAG: NADH:ubiquinone reductase (Na(+)-transporting) subunit C [Bacteroidetes bacterium]|nr:NADH:ubiquinone reductase (Na(+)-transporting) subunit C [Bacteroidota bacterium]